ncbi:MAG: ABC transporter permease [Clostridia bacterium]
MKAYLSFFRIRFLNNLQYKVAAWAGMATQFVWGGMYILLYTAIYSFSSSPKPMELDQLTTYVWLQQAFLALIMLWYRDSGLFDLILSGDVAYELVRPINLYPMWYARLLSQRLAGVLLRFAPIIIVSILLPFPYGLSAPASFPSFMLFIGTLLNGTLLTVAYSMLISISMFRTLSAVGSLTLFGILSEFLGGMVIPLPLMPESLQKILMVLPFWLTGDFPFRIYTGHIPVQEALGGIMLQFLWTAVLITAGVLWLRNIKKKIVIQGG